ncbi:DMT family transporter [Halomicrobium salinisoli]|uniref:DMT family transporter n=1 Tax=Halomicrobium salinisoli TaxID=2878391 RepID=UPI001CEFDBA4|nr:DMT family transporter [Halomicrobium salinisoli]
MIARRHANAGLFVVLAALFGVSFVAIKAGLAAIPPLLFAAIRFDVAAPFVLAYAAWRYDDWVPRDRSDLVSVAVGAVALVAANNGLLFLGQQTTTPATASVMYGLNPILAPAFAYLLLDQRVDRLGFAGVLLGLVGVVIIVQPSPATLTDASTLGQLYVLGAAVVVALGSVLLRRFESTIGSVPMTAWAMALGAGLLHVASVAAGESLAPGAWSRTVLLSILSLGLFSTAMAYPIYFALIRRIGPVRTNLVAYLVPVVAALTGWVLLDEPVTLATVAGFVVVVAGVVLLERQVIREEAARAYDALAGGGAAASSDD